MNDYKGSRTVRPYRSLYDTLKSIDLQIQQSIDFANMWANYYHYGKMDAEQIFNHLKTQVHYKEDPKNIELLQSMPSLFLDNYWGKPGTGDCDCFTITACSVLLVCGFKTGYTIYGNGRQ